MNWLLCYIEDTDEVPDILTHHSNPENDSSLPEQISVSSQYPIRVSRYGRPIILPARYRDMSHVTDMPYNYPVSM